MSYDSSDSIRITPYHLLTDDAKNTSKSGLQIFPWKETHQKRSEQKIAKVWKALPRTPRCVLGYWGPAASCGTEETRRLLRVAGQNISARTSPPQSGAGQARRQLGQSQTWASDTSMGMGMGWGQSGTVACRWGSGPKSGRRISQSQPGLAMQGGGDRASCCWCLIPKKPCEYCGV